MSNKRIEHIGIVQSVDAQGILIRMERIASCAACQAKSACSIANDEDKTLLLPTPPFQLFTVGETVNVVMRSSQAWHAVWLAYVCPLLVLVGSLLGLFSLGLSEFIVGISALAITVVYYFILYLFRHKISKEFSFAIEKIV
ncbi:MAG: SoxR reducing system RseC family protein [Bacteroidales bacterium]